MKLNGMIAAALISVACVTGGKTAQGTPQPAPAAQPQTAAPTQKPDASAQKPSGAAPVGGTTGTATNADAAVLADFRARVDKYLDVRKQAEKDAPALKEADDPAKITAAQDAQAARIRTLRSAAQPGDLFTPPVRTLFRRLLYPETQGEDGRDAKEVLREDAPASVPLKVHAKYPEGAPLPSVPSNFLLNLPTLPKPLEYRIINKNLILLDADANIIVDYMTGVIR